MKINPLTPGRQFGNVDIDNFNTRKYGSEYKEKERQDIILFNALLTLV